MKQLKILGNDWQIELFGDRGGANFSCGKRKINLGTLNKFSTLGSLFHEIAEIVLVERMYRYTQFVDDTNDGMIFTMSHKEFSLFMDDFVTAISPLLKENPLAALPNVGSKVLKSLTKKSSCVKNKIKTKGAVSCRKYAKTKAAKNHLKPKVL
jgi:hypothetical protein